MAMALFLLQFEISGGVICVEAFEDFPQMGRFTLRDEGKTIAMGKVSTDKYHRRFMRTDKNHWHPFTYSRISKSGEAVNPLFQYSKLKFDLVQYFGLINRLTVAKIFRCF